MLARRAERARREDASERQLIIKLHGDITQGEFGLAQDEIDHAVRAARRYIKDELDADLVMVGYEAESGPLNEWLARARSGFWWVDEEPSRIPMDPTHVRWVPLGVSDFFATLAPQLFTLRTMNARPRGLPRGPDGAARGHGRPGGDLGTRDSATRDRPPEGGRHHRRSPPPPAPLPCSGRSSRPSACAASASSRIGSALIPTSARPARAAGAHRAGRRRRGRCRARGWRRAYLLSQLAAVRSQIEAAHPIRTSCPPRSARCSVADRLGPTVLNPQDIRALAGFGPSTLVRV